MNKFFVCTLVYAAVFTFLSSASAGQFKYPDEINYDDMSYKLAYKKELPNGRAIYEFTANSEKVEHWTTLITLNYSKQPTSTPKHWLDAMRLQLKRDQALAELNKFNEIDGHGYVGFVFGPTSQYPEFEVNASKSFHNEKCGGILTLQYAKKYAKDAVLELVNQDLDKFLTTLNQMNWLPACE